MPMIRSLYPDDWTEIATRLKELVDWHCEDCGKQCRRPGEKFATHQDTLTVAHLNHTPSDCMGENLACLCAPCHLRYDAPHRRLRRITRKREESQ